MEKTSLLVVQPTPFCNISCNYCYLGDRSSRAQMSPSTVQAIIDRVINSTFIDVDFEIAFHAGEPLVVSLKWYEEFIGSVLSQTAVRPIFNIQTNGTLISPSWASFFKEHRFRVGISVDGPAWINDQVRQTRNGGGTAARVMSGIECLRKHDVKYSLICVVSSVNIKHAREVFDFFMDLMPQSVSFNFEEIEGANNPKNLLGAVNKESAAAFLNEFWDLCVMYNWPFSVREIDQVIKNVVFVAHGGQIGNSVNRPGRCLTVACDGGIFPYSPELLSNNDRPKMSLQIGNINTESLNECYSSSVFYAMEDEISTGVYECEKSCFYFSFCGGGSPSNKLCEHQTFRETETSHCRSSIQAPLDVCINRMAHAVKTGGTLHGASDIVGAPSR